MIRIAKMTDYGVLVGTHLASIAPGAVLSVAELSEATHIPAPTVSKVLKILSNGGVVKAKRGARGGYCLAKPAKDLPMSEVIEALEGPIAVTECAVEDAEGACVYEGSCSVQGNWKRINAVLQNALASVTLADMARPEGGDLVHLRLRSAPESSVVEA